MANLNSAYPATKLRVYKRCNMLKISSGRVFAMLAFLFSGASAHAKETPWFLLHRENGCLPLAGLVQVYPYLRGHRSPRAIFKAVRARNPDARLRPFLEAVAEEQRQDGATPGAEERRLYANFTKSNAYLVSSEKAALEFALFSRELCQRLGGLPGQTESP